MAQNDILLNDDLNLQEKNNEWIEGNSDQENVELTMLVNKGEIRQYPFHGFGIEKRIKKVADPKNFIRDLKVELENDGYSNPEITASGNLDDLKVFINA